MERTPFKKPPPQTNLKKSLSTFSHILGLPLHSAESSEKIKKLQSSIYEAMTESQKQVVSLNNPDLFHITLTMLSLPRLETQEKAKEVFEKRCEEIQKIHGSMKVNLKNLGCFTQPYKHSKGNDEFDEVSLIYLDLKDDQYLKNLQLTCHIIIKDFLENEIIHEDDLKEMNVIFKNGRFQPQKMHVTLFRVREQSYKNDSGKYVKYNWRNIFDEFGTCDLGTADYPQIEISIRCSLVKDATCKPLALIESLKSESDEKVETK